MRLINTAFFWNLESHYRPDGRGFEPGLLSVKLSNPAGRGTSPDAPAGGKFRDGAGVLWLFLGKALRAEFEARRVLKPFPFGVHISAHIKRKRNNGYRLSN
jgi:hypothetical protein